jgi:hypothetical protein
MHNSGKAIIATSDEQLQKAIHLLLHEAREGVDERRAKQREPFFAPVRFSMAQDPRREFTCFSRDISATGLGLLHCMAVEPGAIVLTIPSKSCGDIRIRGRIVWCQPCGEGWYLSGVQFVDFLERT